MSNVGGMRTLTDQPRHPREVRERMEVEADMIRITGDDALLRLTRDCRFPEAKARRLLNIAWEFGQKAEPCPGGYVHVWYHGFSEVTTAPRPHMYSVVEHIGGKVARKSDPRYTQSSERKPSRNTGTARKRSKGNTMPPRKGSTKTRQAAPEPETQAANGEVDYQKLIDKPLSATMADYVIWFEQNVASLDELDVDKILTLGVSLYSKFQKSDFNIEQRDARAAEREQTRQTDEDEPEPAKPARRSAKPAPATTARAGGRPARGAKAPATRTRGRRAAAPAGADAAGGDAPF